jgi:hypothetical protein
MSAEETLKSAGLERIAGRLCAEGELETTTDLGKLSDVEIDGIGWLLPQQKKKLKCLCEACRRGDPGLLQKVWRERRPVGGQRMENLLAMLRETRDNWGSGW